MKTRQWRLRTQLSLSMIFTALIALGVFIIGMITFYLVVQDSWMAGLSAESRATLQTLIDGGDVSSDALATLISSFSLSWVGGHAEAELYSLIVLIILAVFSAVVVGIIVARKLSTPIETVTSAALEIASGNLKHKLPDVTGGASEIEHMLSAFQTMAQSLEDAERETTESAAAIAHELRTPLTILRGRLQGLGDGVFAPSKEMTEGLIAQVDTLSQIVTDLGLLSRLSSGRFELQAIDVDLAEEVVTVLTTMRPDLEGLGFKVETFLSPLAVHADPVRVRQALAALIENVKRYAADGEYLNVRTRSDDRFAYIEVGDHGPGIPPAHRQKIFERWWHEDLNGTSPDNGTGLGLAIVKAIAEAHGGEVVAQQQPDSAGALLILKLPLPSL